MPTPYRGRVEAAVALNATCVGCHADEAAAWSRSMHRHAYDNRAFQAALALEPTDFCRGCHAPEANPSAPAVAVELGVACVTCHVTTPGSVLAGPSGPRGASAPHAVIRSAAFAGSASCASCHEFPFPGAPSNEDARLMQTTLREHARSDASARGCTSCHRAHAFDEVRDPAWLRQQLRVRAELVAAAGKRSARLTLEQAAPGHAFPTGDLFRRLAVRVGAETRYLARHFERRRELTGDDRVLDEPRVVEVPLLADQRLPVAWSVTLERVATIGTGADPAHAMIESEVLLHAGVLAEEKN